MTERGRERKGARERERKKKRETERKTERGSKVIEVTRGKKRVRLFRR